MSKNLIHENYVEAAEILNVPIATIYAVADIESAGNGFQHDGKPKILFERHYFYKFTGGEYSSKYPEICNRKRGGYTNNEWDRLDLAAFLDIEAAYKSASWGKFQIMGFNYEVCGYNSVLKFVEDMRESEANHLKAFINFIINNSLDKFLKNQDFRSFARYYNGPLYYKHSYDKRIARAFRAYSEKYPEVDAKQMSILEIQTLLKSKGFDPGILDGVYGKNTAAAIKQFQKSINENQTGRISKKLVELLKG